MLPAPTEKASLPIIDEQPPQEEEPQPVAEIRKKTTAILQGIHFSIHTATEERLTEQIEGLNPEVFRQIGFSVEDWSKVVDDKYKAKLTRGRGWKGRGKRISQTERVRVIRFSPFPSSFSNTLRTIRRDLYEALHANCLVLEGEVHGGFKQNIYILPYTNAPAIMRIIQQKNMEIDQLNGKIQEFIQSSDFEDLKTMLAPYNVKVEENHRVWTVEHVTFDATPLALEPATVENLVEQEYKARFEKMKAEERVAYQEGMEALSKELERRSQELVVKGIENIKKKINFIVKRIVSSRKKPEKIKEDLENLRRLALSVGLSEVALSVIDPLTEVANHPEKAMEIFGTKDLNEAIDGRLKGLIANL